MDNLNKGDNEMVGEKIGTVTVTMYKENKTGLPFFYVQSENEDVIQVSYIIEDILHKY